ncbi:MAG: hypothetical protein JNL38_29585 [Myxococcales bacterium]|nr:hypothetical protein [Myxococcales bacterium]
MRTITLFAAASMLALAACATQTDGADDGNDERTQATEEALSTSALAKKLVGAYDTQDSKYPTLDLAQGGTYSRDTGIRCITTPCPSGDTGTWRIYRSLFGNAFVRLVATNGQDDWYQVKLGSGGDVAQLRGVFGTKGTFVPAVKYNPCMAVKCTALTTCQVVNGGAQCVPNYPTCATTLCAAPKVCKDRPIVCVMAPCAPTAPSCEYVCPADGWINCMPGPGPKNPACSGEYHTFIKDNCPGVGFAY